MTNQNHGNPVEPLESNSGFAVVPLTARSLADVEIPEKPSAWLGHLPFAQWVVEVARPATFVELGTHYGHSYFAFCQAVQANELATRCFAIDTWEGDEHAGTYGRDIYDQVRRINERDYHAFSTLLRMRFDDALPTFESGTVDLLHIDGLHSYEAVRHDFETWLPKLSASGIVLFHDTDVRDRGFGVWQLWDELIQQYPGFKFEHSSGLGVLLVGPEQTPAMQALVRIGKDAGAAISPLSLFAALGKRYEVYSKLLESSAREHDLAARLNAAIAEATATAKRRQVDQANLKSANQHLARLQSDHQLLNQAIEHLRQDHYHLLQSTSWRITRPYRFLGTQVLKFRHVARFAPAAMRLAGGPRALVGKAVQIARQEGIPGIRERVRFLVSRGTALQAGNGLIPKAQVGRVPALGAGEVPTHTATVDIIVCVHNALDDVRRCLQSVVSCTQPPFRLIVVDDGSGPETQAFLQAFMADQPDNLIRHDQAKGYTLAANAGMRLSDADFVVMLNSDTVVSALWLDRLVRCAQSDSSIGLVGPLSNTASWQSTPQIFDADGDWALNSLAAGETVESRAQQLASMSARVYPRVGFLNGFCILISRRLMDDIGIFDEEGFGRGFGEENDYCLRARAAGWQLAVADDAYVFHAQSKSYSDERRRELVALADKALRERHADENIDTGLEMTRYSRVLQATRARTAQAGTLDVIREQLRKKYEGRRVLFVLPVVESGGGANVVIADALAMSRAGIYTVIANMRSHREIFQANYPGLSLPVIYLDDAEDLANHVAPFDAVIATVFFTAPWVATSLNAPGAPTVGGYYIQDFEPDFFDERHDNYAKALDSYRLPALKLFTKTSWTAGRIASHGVQSPIVIGPSFQRELFFPIDRPRHVTPVRLVAMVRPSTPRRSPEATVRVLLQLAKANPHQLAVEVFGVEAEHDLMQQLGRQSNVSVGGHLSPPQVAALLRSADIFLDLSVFQAMGLTAIEAMASGAVVVGPINGGLSEIVEDGVSGLLVDTLDERQAERAVQKLIDDWEFRDQLMRNALEKSAAIFPETAALKMLDHLFGPGN